MEYDANSRSQLSIACILGASIAFSLNDVLIKLLSTGYPLHQVVLVRAVIALLITLAIFVPRDGVRRVFQTRRPVIQTVRGLLLVTANLTFFTGLAVIPIAEATAIFFVSPLLVTAFSVLFLRETAGPRRWLALAVGGTGVLLIVRPGGVDFHWALFLPLAAAAAYAAVNTLTRGLGMAERASTMAVYVHLNFVAVCLIAGLAFGDGRYSGSDNPSVEFLFRPWRMFAPEDFLVTAASGAAIAAGAYLISQAYRSSEASLIAPLEYVSLVSAIIWGFVIWGEIPNIFSWAGIALIVGSGIFVAVREAEIGIKR